MPKKTLNDPFTNLQLTAEEQALEEVLANEEYESDPNLAQTDVMLREAAAQYRILQSTKPVTIRLNQLDLIKIKAKAKRHDLPYQTLISIIIHDYAQEKNFIQI